MSRDLNEGFGLFLEKSSVKFAFYRGGIETLVNEIAYDPTQHKFFRIRTEDGSLFFDVSPDGISFSNESSASISTMPLDAMVLTSSFIATVGQADGTLTIRSITGVISDSP